MAFEAYKESYSGKIRPVTIGKGNAAVTVGGETTFPFYTQEGDMPNKPKIAMEIWDMEPEDWPESAVAPFKDVLGDPVAWAKKCVDEYGAEVIALQLKSIDPNGKDTPAEEAAQLVKKVAEGIDVPLIVWGVANVQKDEEVLKRVAELCDGMNLAIGPVEDTNHKGIGAAAMGFGQTVIGSSPIDVNLAKQCNILLENLGLPLDRILVDPTTGGLGYGLEYSYSVMERLEAAALSQGDEKLQNPLINNLGNEIWKSKEAKQPLEEDQVLGDPERRGILMEVVGGTAYLLAGSDLLIVRHPESARLLKAFVDLALNGGSARDVAAIDKKLPESDIDYAALAPEPDLTVEEKKAAAKPAAKPAPKAEAKPEPKAEAKPAPKAEAAPAPKPEAAAPAKEAPKESAEEAAAREKAEAEARAKAEAEAKVKAEEEAKAKAEAEKKAKEEAEAKKKAEEKAKAKAEADKREAEEEALRAKRREEAEKRSAERATEHAGTVPMTPAKEQLSDIDKLAAQIVRNHRSGWPS
ncbi:MAG: acetyl-CoA decarbonylase/synthase complex subunit delta [Desulfatibacillaceae bacterium]